MKNPTSWKIR